MINMTDMVRTAMDMRVLDRMERDGKDMEPVSYTSGVLNGVTAAIEAFTVAIHAETDDVQIVLVREDQTNEQMLHRLITEIERTNP